MELLLSTIISYLIGVAANLRTDSILQSRERSLNTQLEKGSVLRKALSSTRPLRDELRIACAKLARDQHRVGVTKAEEPLWRLLSDDEFQEDLAEWFMAGCIVEGKATKERLLKRMEDALSDSKASPEQINFLKSGYFDAIDKAVFSHPVLAHWRHQLSLNYLRDQVTLLRRRAEEAAGIYSHEKQETALTNYCNKALAAWDIIDLSNLPEGDIHMATQKLLLRQLYMPLRIELEAIKRGESDDAALARLEKRREARRNVEGGRVFLDEPDHPDEIEQRSPVGACLGSSRRLVILGDPGGGKTTMLRWMATAYLLRHTGDDAFSQIPDTDTLPASPWIPVLIRCRELGETDLCRCFTDFLTQHLNKTELLPEDADIMRTVILDRIAKGEVLLLVDGLDEITDPLVRMMFCQELERTSARYPDTPIVATSRIVGYRDMPYRMGSGFRHGVIAELSREDKELFARRWVEVTEQHQTATDKGKRYYELIDALHSSDRIERLTGNPMLLTTLALVKRKVGKLPTRRNKLYAEAVSVLLNWNPRRYQPIEESEAIPQLEYLAYEMCLRGVQRLTNDEVLDLLDKLRIEYPNIRAIRSRDPHAFLALLEARSSILIKSGGVWVENKSQEKHVWEFRHLTFQEYLAARALVDGRYSGRDKTKSLAEQVAPLAGTVEKLVFDHFLPAGDEGGDLENDVEAPESWREALRLLVADCKDDDVDEVLLAILKPMGTEDSSRTGRPRAVLAAECLADEPNVSEEIAEQVLLALVSYISEGDEEAGPEESLVQAAIDITGSIWCSTFRKLLTEELCQRKPGKRWDVGGIWGTAEKACWKRLGTDAKTFFTELTVRLQSCDRVEVISAALTIMEAAYEGDIEIVDGLPEALLGLVTSADLQAKFAAAWALGWIIKGPYAGEGEIGWKPKREELDVITVTLETTSVSESDTRRWLIIILGCSNDPSVIPLLSRQLDDPNATVRSAAITALGQVGAQEVIQPLLSKLHDADADVQRAIIGALVQVGEKATVGHILARLDDPEVDVRKAVIEVLRQLGDKQAVQPLLQKLDDPDAGVRTKVVVALGAIGDERAVEPLLAKIRDPNPNVRKNVAEVLVHLGGKKVIEPVLSLLDDPDHGVRKLAVQVLERIGDLGVAERLTLLLQSTDHALCVAAAAALTTFGVEGAEIALKEFEQHESQEVRQAATREIRRLRLNSRKLVFDTEDPEGLKF